MTTPNYSLTAAAWPFEFLLPESLSLLGVSPSTACWGAAACVCPWLLSPWSSVTLSAQEEDRGSQDSTWAALGMTWTFAHASDKGWNVLKRENTPCKIVGVMGGSGGRPCGSRRLRQGQGKGSEAHQSLSREKVAWGNQCGKPSRDREVAWGSAPGREQSPPWPAGLGRRWVIQRPRLRGRWERLWASTSRGGASETHDHPPLPDRRLSMACGGVELEAPGSLRHPGQVRLSLHAED